MVHLFQLLLRCGQGIWRGVEHVGLKALIREVNSKGFVIFLKMGRVCQVGSFIDSKNKPRSTNLRDILSMRRRRVSSHRAASKRGKCPAPKRRGVTREQRSREHGGKASETQLIARGWRTAKDKMDYLSAHEMLGIQDFPSRVSASLAKLPSRNGRRCTETENGLPRMQTRQTPRRLHRNSQVRAHRSPASTTRPYRWRR